MKIDSLTIFEQGSYTELSTGSCGLDKNIDLEQYSELIVSIKNQIGGNFSRASSDPGVVRVVSTRCPFGDAVKEAPELCRMTSSVFGGIAARNFGYAKVALNKRIATNDGICEVSIYTDPDLAAHYDGDEYESDSGVVTSKSITAGTAIRIEEGLKKMWCHTQQPTAKNLPKTFFVAESAVMRQVFKSIEIVAPSDASVQITGETGVGKELVARSTHALSNRWQQPFVVVNCGAIPENLIESALFGHEKGAFTGAYNVHHGYFERADKGTLFLDEIDAFPVSAQAQLLRIFQEGEFERVGGRQTLKSDVRVICASNRSIEEMVVSGDFREDLFYRLNVIPIHIPPLRERLEDISALANQFLRKLSDKYKGKPKILSESAWLAMLSYSWPGNVRELENILERAFLFSQTHIIDELDITDCNAQKSVASKDIDNLNLRKLKKVAAIELEKKIIHAGLSQFSGNVSQAAQAMGISTRAVHQKLKIHDINPFDYRK
ncbi:sigma 54-interacting transcriptional regulator [Solemya elarraichensis gill symbiont]|uniref:Fis family transcriptional regulator n=1 Tax=Solemya elarraichensis gill symbiont TaxID=1918949 RepID=A0A1T2LB13_9GAMM|nr:sigma 54-interacting transcriptional regulator [Solemya elarraichensis gill symbiont]OOZ42244.1 Fis family transcriptional regulator [Solemya elarraichensis gill symbiont]